MHQCTLLHPEALALSANVAETLEIGERHIGAFTAQDG